MGRNNLRWWLGLLGALVILALAAPQPPRVVFDLRLPGQSGFTLVLDNPVAGGDVYRANLALPADGRLSVTTEFPPEVNATTFWM